MNPLVAEYRSLPPSSDHLPDAGPNDQPDSDRPDAEIAEGPLPPPDLPV